jgi:hypothetical protein
VCGQAGATCGPPREMVCQHRGMLWGGMEVARLLLLLPLKLGAKAAAALPFLVTHDMACPTATRQLLFVSISPPHSGVL